MKLSRILVLLLSLIMALSLFACDSGKEEGSVETKSEAPSGNDSELNSDSESETVPGSESEPDSETVPGSESETNIESGSGTESDTEPVTPGEVKVITIAEALELCGEPGNITDERYEIHATIKTITNAQYGAMVIYDATGEISVYGTYSADGSIGYGDFAEKPYKGDDVVLHCILQNYNGTKEVKNARLIEFKSNQGNFDVSDYKSATIAQARAAATGEKLLVSGIVARITYANGMKPNGFILVNGGDSIYVYDADAAGMVSIGNSVEIAASKTYWILEDEQYNAATHGYKGCNQLEDATVVSNDKGNNDWISESFPTATVKEIMDHPVSNDITTQIYKVTALVKKVPGNGFVNYYIDDLDGVTGSYSYTQCNGKDFSWLDEFDGKICTVYLVVLNAKSNAAGCLYRFLPIKVVYENFVFNTDNAAEHAVKYYGVDQFDDLYTGDPSLELTTSISSELLGFENATLSYASSNESVIKISTADGKTVMNCLKSGEATITVTGTYNGKEYSETVTVTVDIPEEEIPSITVSEAIASEIGEVITVKGIVASSVANKNAGFYLIDETGVITVLTDTATIATLKIGDEIIIKGTRGLSKDTDGQIYINNAELLQNNYGENAYSTAPFITGKTLADVIALNGDTAQTTEVYVITASIVRETTAYSTNTYVVDGDNKFMLYAGGKGQYAWLDNYVGQTLTIELAVCDWNNKGNKGCILSITTSDGTQIFNEINFSK